MKRFGLGLLAALVMLAACSEPPAELKDPDLAALFQAINELRSSGGRCPTGEMEPVDPLRLSGPIIAAAQHHAEDLAAAGVLSHESPPGSRYYPPGTGPLGRVTREGCPCLRVAEDLAEAGSWQEALSAWQASTAGHCEALFDVDYKTGARLGLTLAGLGHAGRYWVLDMGKPR